MKQVALVGKPNAGKSSLFNLLTGLNQKIGNYNGVTVERKVGQYQGIEIIDLPGIKSLSAVSPEEEIAKQAILEYSQSQKPILYVANGLQLEESLIFFSELADLQIPAAIAINFKDDLEKFNFKLDVPQLQNQLGCPVYLMNSRNGEGLEDLESLFTNMDFKVPNAVNRSHYDRVENDQFNNAYFAAVSNQAHVQDPKDFLKRKQLIGDLLKKSFTQENPEQILATSKAWDKMLLHPIIGVLGFLFTLLVIFQSVFYLSAFPMDWIDAGFASLTSFANSNISNEHLASFISDGILAGLGGVLIFIPQIAILFFLLGILEHSGYLARISYISNRFLSNFGLSGQSVIPLMSSWACAIPAIMSARVINDPKERMAVMFAAP